MTVGEQFAKTKQKLSMIHIDDIRPNPLNKYHIYQEEIQALAMELEQNGVNNGRVYYQEADDGKHYTLIGGETRYHALKLLYQEGRHDGLFPMYILPQRPENELEELELIMSDNHQRYLSEEDKKEIVQDLERIYEYHKMHDRELDKEIRNATSELQKELLEEQRKIPKGMHRRDWIAMKAGFINRNGTNISGRQIQKYMTGIYSGKSDLEKNSNSKVKAEEKKDDANDLQKQTLEKLKRHLVEVTDATVKVTSTKLTIGYANIYDLHRILETLKEDQNLDIFTKQYAKRGR